MTNETQTDRLAEVMERLDYTFDHGIFDAVEAGKYIDYKECRDLIQSQQAEIERLTAELKLWDMLVEDEGGCPRYNVQRGAALNSVATSTKALLRRAALNPHPGTESGK